MFEGEVEFLDNIASGYGGAILNHAELKFINSTGLGLNFKGNFCGEQDVRRNPHVLI